MDFQITPSNDQERTILNSFQHAMAQLDPRKLVYDAIKNDFSSINVKGRVSILAFGKAASKMLMGALDFFGGSEIRASAIVPQGVSVDGIPAWVKLLRGTHPVPTTASVSATDQAISYLFNGFDPDITVVLISGGGSSLLELPEEWTNIDEINRVSKCLMDNGADINELNAVRRHMSKVKGGGLNQFLKGDQRKGYVISDVPGDKLDVIASGPLTTPSSDPVKDVIEKYKDNCQELSRLEKHIKTEMLKEHGNATDVKIILRNRDFVDCIYRYLSGLGYEAVSLGSSLTGDVEEFSRFISSSVRSIYSRKKIPFFFVGGGETTSAIRGNGIGGRNCELALRVLKQFRTDEFFAFASLGTDGVDGNSPATGAMVGTPTKEVIKESLIDDYLSRSDSYSLLKKFGRSVETGPTGNNVSDIFIGFYGGQSQK
ncbi:MAG: DUF4147 domain-containing protein [Thermoplasmataceae archaeon]